MTLISVLTVVKEAAKMKKHNLFTESRYHFSTSSLYSTPPGSIPGSPGHINSSPSRCHAKPASPLLVQAKALREELDVPKQVEVQACISQLQKELAEEPAGGQKTEENEGIQRPLSAERATNITSTTPQIHIVHPMIREETNEDTENLKEGQNTKAEPVMQISLSTEVPVDPPCLVNKLIAAVSPQSLVETILKGVEPVSNGAPINCSYAEEDTRPLDQVWQNNETSPGSSQVSMETKSAGSVCSVALDKPGSHCEASVSAPSAGQEKESSTTPDTEVLADDLTDDDRESGTTPDTVPSDGVSFAPSIREIVEITEGTDPATEVTSGVPEAQEFLIEMCEAISDAEASMEALVNSAHSSENESSETSATTESAVNPQPTSPKTTPHTEQPPCPESPEAQPVARPPDCIKEIRDLVVEVIEVEEMVQRYPDDGEV